VQPAVGAPVSAGGLDYMTHRGPFQPLLFCESVILCDLLSLRLSLVLQGPLLPAQVGYWAQPRCLLLELELQQLPCPPGKLGQRRGSWDNASGCSSRGAGRAGCDCLLGWSS